MISISEKQKISFEEAKNALMNANSVCIISHRSPDADAVGANLALRMQLEKLGKKVVSASVDPVPSDSLFLKGIENFVTDFDYSEFDVIVSVDCGDIGLVKYHIDKPEILTGEKPFINFDHHESNDNFGSINVVDFDACATCFILYNFFDYCNWHIDREIATCLLHGIYFDTGSLMHSNTSAPVYEVAGELVRKGADLRKIVKNLFRTTPIRKMRLWGRILERAFINDQGVTVSAVNASDYLACDASTKDTGGAIDFLNSVPNAKYCVLLSENEKGVVKGSLRTQRDDVNLSDIASQWGGGGHPRASGFGIMGKLEPTTVWRVISEDESSPNVEF